MKTHLVTIKSFLPVILTALLLLFLNFEIFAQNMAPSKGKGTSCGVSEDGPIYLKGLTKGEGITFVDSKGKTCSSGKTTNKNDYPHFVKLLTAKYDQNEITEDVFLRIMEELEKRERLRKYMASIDGPADPVILKLIYEGLK